MSRNIPDCHTWAGRRAVLSISSPERPVMLKHCPMHRPGPHSKELSSPKMSTVPRLRNPDLCDLPNEENHSEERPCLPGLREGTRGHCGVTEVFCTTSVVGITTASPVETHQMAHLKPVSLTLGKSTSTQLFSKSGKERKSESWSWKLGRTWLMPTHIPPEDNVASGSGLGCSLTPPIPPVPFLGSKQQRRWGAGGAPVCPHQGPPTRGGHGHPGRGCFSSATKPTSAPTAPCSKEQTLRS